MAYTVGQLSRLTGLTVRALHHYDAIGLLSPSHRSDAGYRLYTQGDVVRLFRVQALQRLGLPLADIGLALTENGEALPQIITRQIDELDANIDHATALRERLARLRDVLAAGSDPATEDWLSALALVSQYDRFCSAPELAKLVSHSRATADQWPRLVEDIRSAMQAGLSPTSEEARTLGVRWQRLIMSQVGGDMALAIKIKRAYSEHPELQARAKAQSGLDTAMVAFLMDVWRQGHAELWARHLDEAELRCLHLSDERMLQWIRVAGEMREAMNDGAPPDSQAVRPLLTQWDQILDACAGDSPHFRRRMEVVLRSDSDLQTTWALDEDLLAFVEAARQRASAGDPDA
jgi:DNA-binding transcriptional MerR regulator